VYFSNYLACCLWAWNKQGAALIPLAIAAATNIVCNLFAIPRFGVDGAATILLITEIIVAAGLCGIQYKLIRHLHVALFGKFLFCAVMALGVGKASVFLSGNNGHEWPALLRLSGASIISGLVYLGLIHLFHLADIKRLWQLVTRVQTSQPVTEV
jgi:O-antigen/teichoic acid export membrane protein